MARDPRIFTPKKAAEAVGCSPDTIRRYCSLYRRHFSPGAVPPPGRPRLLTGDDVYLLKIAKLQTESGLTVEEVDKLLDTVALPAAAAGDDDTVETAIEKPVEVPEALALLRQMATTIDRLEARDRRLEALEGEVADLRRRVETGVGSPAGGEASTVSPWASYVPFLVGVGLIALILLTVAIVVALTL